MLKLVLVGLAFAAVNALNTIVPYRRLSEQRHNNCPFRQTCTELPVITEPSEEEDLQQHDSRDVSDQVANKNDGSFGLKKLVDNAFRSGEKEKSSINNDNDGMLSAASGLAAVAKKGSSDVNSFATDATTRLKEIAEQGSSNVVSVAGATSSRVTKLVEKGTADVVSVAGATTSRLTELVEKGSSDVVSVADATTSRVMEFTEKGTSDVAGAVQWINLQATGGINFMTDQSKALVLNFTGKKEYQFGDITKELTRRVVSGEYNMQDILLLCKVLIAIGATFSPLAKVLPIKVILDMFNFSLEQQIGGKLLEVIAGSLDERFTAALFTGDDKYQLGDFTKRTLTNSILDFTGKASYESGDMKRAVEERTTSSNDEVQENKEGGINAMDHDQSCSSEQDNDNNYSKQPYQPTTITTAPTETAAVSDSSSASLSSFSTKRLELQVGPEFEEWDKVFREKHPDDVSLSIAKCLDNTGNEMNDRGDSLTRNKVLDVEIATELEEWDRMFQAKFYPDDTMNR